VLIILIIDDDESTRFLLKRIFKRRFTCAVIEAENGEIGLKALQEFLPDLVLLDLTMPVMDGVETLRIIRASTIFKNIPVLVITALNEKNLVGSLADKGISDYILKPIDPELAFKRIQNTINRIIVNTNKSDKKENFYSKDGLYQILIVDKNADFKAFFTSLLGNKFVIHEASSGIEGLNIFTRYKPNYIFVSDKFGMLDKKILTEKVREVAEDRDVSIYLLTENTKESSSRIFFFDGVLNKTSDPDLFLRDFSKLVLMIVDPLEKIESVVTSSVPNFQKLIQMTFFEYAKKEITIIELNEYKDTDEYFCLFTKISDVEEGVYLLIYLSGSEKNIVSLTNQISINIGCTNKTANEIFKDLFKILVEKICSVLNEKGYSFPSNILVELEPMKTLIDKNWRINISINSKDNELFSIGFIFGKL